MRQEMDGSDGCCRRRKEKAAAAKDTTAKGKGCCSALVFRRAIGCQVARKQEIG
jgi:hypothetical protein